MNVDSRTQQIIKAMGKHPNFKMTRNQEKELYDYQGFTHEDDDDDDYEQSEKWSLLTPHQKIEKLELKKLATTQRFQNISGMENPQAELENLMKFSIEKHQVESVRMILKIGLWVNGRHSKPDVIGIEAEKPDTEVGFRTVVDYEKRKTEEAGEPKNDNLHKIENLLKKYGCSTENQVKQAKILEEQEFQALIDTLASANNTSKQLLLSFIGLLKSDLITIIRVIKADAARKNKIRMNDRSKSQRKGTQESSLVNKLVSANNSNIISFANAKLLPGAEILLDTILEMNNDQDDYAKFGDVAPYFPSDDDIILTVQEYTRELIKWKAEEVSSLPERPFPSSNMAMSTSSINKRSGKAQQVCEFDGKDYTEYWKTLSKKYATQFCKFVSNLKVREVKLSLGRYIARKIFSVVDITREDIEDICDESDDKNVLAAAKLLTYIEKASVQKILQMKDCVKEVYCSDQTKGNSVVLVDENAVIICLSQKKIDASYDFYKDTSFFSQDRKNKKVCETLLEEILQEYQSVPFFILGNKPCGNLTAESICKKIVEEISEEENSLNKLKLFLFGRNNRKTNILAANHIERLTAREYFEQKLEKSKAKRLEEAKLQEEAEQRSSITLSDQLQGFQDRTDEWRRQMKKENDRRKVNVDLANVFKSILFSDAAQQNDKTPRLDDVKELIATAIEKGAEIHQIRLDFPKPESSTRIERKCQQIERVANRIGKYAPSQSSRKLFHVAVASGNLPLVEYLVTEHGFDVNDTEKFLPHIPLYYAIDDFEMLDYLLKEGATFDKSNLDDCHYCQLLIVESVADDLMKIGPRNANLLFGNIRKSFKPELDFEDEKSESPEEKAEDVQELKDKENPEQSPNKDALKEFEKALDVKEEKFDLSFFYDFYQYPEETRVLENYSYFLILRLQKQTLNFIEYKEIVEEVSFNSRRTLYNVAMCFVSECLRLEEKPKSLSSQITQKSPQSPQVKTVEDEKLKQKSEQIKKYNSQFFEGDDPIAVYNRAIKIILGHDMDKFDKAFELCSKVEDNWDFEFLKARIYLWKADSQFIDLQSEQAHLEEAIKTIVKFENSLPPRLREDLNKIEEVYEKGTYEIPKKVERDESFWTSRHTMYFYLKGIYAYVTRDIRKAEYYLVKAMSLDDCFNEAKITWMNIKVRDGRCSSLDEINSEFSQEILSYTDEETFQNIIKDIETKDFINVQSSRKLAELDFNNVLREAFVVHPKYAKDMLTYLLPNKIDKKFVQGIDFAINILNKGSMDDQHKVFLKI